MKITLKIFNIIYLILAAIAITCFFTRPYISVEGYYTVENEQLRSFLPEDISEILTDEELNEALEGEKIAVPVIINVPSSAVFHVNDKEYIEATINTTIAATVDYTVAELDPTFHKISIVIAKKTSNVLITAQISETIKNHLPEGTTDEEIDEKMKAVGIDDNYVKDVTEKVYSSLTQEGATVGSVLDSISDNIVDVAAKISNIDDIDVDYDPVDAAIQMHDNLYTNMYDTFKEYGICDESGKILDIDHAMDAFLVSMLNGLFPSEDEAPKPEETASEAHITRDAPSEEVQNELSAACRKIIINYLTEKDIAGRISQYSLYIFFATLFLMMPWVVLAIFSFIRILRPKKCWVKTWYVFVFAFVQVILGVVLYIGTKYFLPQIAHSLPLGDLNKVLDSLKLTITTSSFIPSIFYLVMIPMTIVYAVFRHIIKKQYKENKILKKSEEANAK